MTQPFTAAHLLSEAEELAHLLRSMNPSVSICESPAKAACRVAILQSAGYVLNPAGLAETQAELDEAARLYSFADQVH